MITFLKQHRSPFLAALIFLSMVAGGWFGILPLYERIESLRDDIQKQYAARENRNRQIATLPDMRLRYEAVLKDEGQLDILLTEPKVVYFIRTIEELARQTETKIAIEANEAPLVQPKKKAVKKEEEAEEGGGSGEEKKAKLLSEMLPFKDYLRLRIILQGQYPDIASFLARMETLPIALDVIGMEVNEKALEEDEAADPSAGRVSPFTLVPGSEPLVVQQPEGEAPAAPPVTPKVSDNLEAVFDVIVYVAK